MPLGLRGCVQGGAVIFSGVDVDVDGNTEVNKSSSLSCTSQPENVQARFSVCAMPWL